MGLWNNHGMDEDDEENDYAIRVLGINAGELTAMVECSRKEAWVWREIAKHKKGQDKRKANLIAKHMELRMEKWIDLAAKYEMEYEEARGIFAEGANG